jgi:hypothetical protein
MSRKVFTAGEVLAAADVNSFLMDQTVMSFAGTAARGSAIPTPTLGMYTHLEDAPARTQFWNGSAWVSPFGSTLVSSASFSGVSTFAMNNIFTSEFDNYKIFVLVNRTSGALRFQMNSGGTPATGANYVYIGWDVNQSGGSGVLGAFDQTSIQVQGASSPPIPAEITLFDPAKAAATRGHYTATFGDGNQQMSLNIATLRHSLTNSYDGLLWSVSSGTMSGNIRVYGMRN